MSYQAALFDLDGTLLDTLDDLADSTNQVLAEFGMPAHPVDPYRFFVGDGMVNLARRAAPDGTPDAVIERMGKRINDIYRENWRRKTHIYEGINGLLGDLAERGCKLAVLSNKPDEFTQVMVRHYFGDDRFAMILGQREGVPKKPDPAGALETAEKLGIAPAAFLYLGDTNTDMRTGVSAGMFTIGVTWGFRPVEELRAAGAMAIIDKPAEALGYLDK